MVLIKNKHLLLTRWAHWLNFPLLFIMIWSGLLIYWAHDVYRVGVGQFTLFRLLPREVLDPLHMDHRLAEGIAFHFFFMWFFAVNGVVYVLFTIFSGHWREMWPDRNALKNAWLVTLHDLGLRKACPPQGKYNAAQQVAYSGIVILGAGSLVTGLAIFRPAQLSWLTFLLGGYQMARWEHFGLTMAYLLFFVVHVAQVARAGWNNFRSMVAGYELVTVPKEAGNE